MIRKSGYLFSEEIMLKQSGRNKMNRLTRRLLIAAAASLAFAGSAIAQDKSIVVASTTSTQDSGLFGHILPMFKAKTGIDVKVVAQGTGQALDTARRGDATSCSSTQSLRKKISVRRFWRQALSRDVQRLRPDRARRAIRPASRDQRTSSQRSARSRPRAPTSFRAATSPAPIRPSSTSGRSQASTSQRTRAPGTRRSGRAWVRR
jgi:hypothetical protein